MVWQTQIFVFLPFYPPNNPKNENFEKLEKTSEDIIILHVCTINHNHIMHGSWDMKHDRQNFLSFWTVLCPFPLQTIKKNQNFEKMKKVPGEIIILHMSTINDSHMMYGSWDIEHGRQDHWIILDHFLPYNPLTTQKIKILKKWKKPWEILFYKCVP